MIDKVCTFLIYVYVIMKLKEKKDDYIGGFGERKMKGETRSL